MQIAFYRARFGNMTDKLVAWCTAGPISHVELIFSNGDWFSSSWRDNGVRYKKIEDLRSHWRIYPIQITPQDELKVRTWCDKEVGKDYDWCGAAGVILPLVKDNHDKWFCSEICISALQTVGLFKRIDTADYSPNALHRLVKRQNRI